jgi:putative membrane protein
MGAADVVPGVSGGTMAFILGIYEELIGAIRSFDLTFLRLLVAFRLRDAMARASWQFLAALGLGILTAVFSLARVLSWLLQNQPILIWSFFFGLILASVLAVSRHLSRLNIIIVMWILLGTLGAYLLVGMVRVSTPDAPWFLFLSGAIAICAMILPGISGSFVLVLLGKYQYVLDAVNNRDLITLILVAGGAGVGLMAFSRLLNWLLKNHHDPTIAILIGLMLGALRKIWPWKKTLENTTDAYGNIMPPIQANVFPSTWNSEVAVALCLMLGGLFVVLFLNFMARERHQSHST